MKTSGSDIVTSTRSEAAVAGRSITGVSIGEYLIRRLQDYGIRHVFGIPGDYVLGFYTMLERKPAATDRLHARRLRRLCRRRLCPRQRHGGGLRHVLRGRA